jgi:hypothetical protein
MAFIVVWLILRKCKLKDYAPLITFAYLLYYCIIAVLLFRDMLPEHMKEPIEEWAGDENIILV